MKKEKIEIRITKLEKEVIKKLAERSGLTVSEFSRRAIFRQSISYKLTPEEIEVYKELHTFRKNFASISNLFKMSDPRLSIEVKELADEVKKHLDKLL